MRTYRSTGPLALAFLLLAAITARPARADFQLINNGGFEAGFAGWTRSETLGSEGTFFLQSTATSPITGLPVPLPPAGSAAAMTDAAGGGTRVLYQDFVVPAGISGATLRFSLFFGNRAPDFFVPSPASLDWNTAALNQQARVDILRAGTDPFSVSGSDVLLSLYQTNPGDPLVTGYIAFTRDVGSLLAAQAGQTLRLRFAQVDNVFPFQFGVDAVSLDASAVPEPSTLFLLGSGITVGLVRQGRRHFRRVV